MLSLRDLIPQPPVSPDFSSCDPWYGFIIEASDCQAAGEKLPRGDIAVPYYVNDPTATHKLPFTVAHGTCTIVVQLAGPATGGPPYLQLVPDDIRGSAGHVIQQCSSITDIETGWCGGFVTRGLTAVTNHLRHEGLPPDYEMNLSDLRFITVTVKGSSVPKREPGDDDAQVPQHIAMDIFRFSRYLPLNSLYFHYSGMINALMDRSHHMINPLHTGPRPTWWESARNPPDEMTYECDANLGSPALVDCSKLQWQGFEQPSDTVQISPGAPKIFFSNTCAMTVSAASQIVLLGSQLMAAFTALLDNCVNDPVSTPSGGRAYYGVHPAPAISIQDMFGPSKIKRDASDISGLNALPPPVNLTIFSHIHSANVTCEAQAAQQRQSVSSCGTA